MYPSQLFFTNDPFPKSQTFDYIYVINKICYDFQRFCHQLKSLDPKIHMILMPHCHWYDLQLATNNEMHISVDIHRFTWQKSDLGNMKSIVQYPQVLYTSLIGHSMSNSQKSRDDCSMYQSSVRQVKEENEKNRTIQYHSSAVIFVFTLSKPLELINRTNTMHYMDKLGPRNNILLLT